MELLPPMCRRNTQVSVERKYCDDFIINKIIPSSTQGAFNLHERQKLKFEILTELIRDLFKYKNSKKCFTTISNLITTCLLSFEETYPLDLCFEESEQLKFEDDDEIKKLLANELDIDLEELPN